MSETSKSGSKKGFFIFIIFVLIMVWVYSKTRDALENGLPHAPPAKTVVTQAPSPAPAAAADAKTTCEGRTLNAIGLFDDPAANQTIDTQSQRYRNLQQLIINGQASAVSFKIVDGRCFALLNVSGTLNGNSISDRIYSMMN